MTWKTLDWILAHSIGSLIGQDHFIVKMCKHIFKIKSLSWLLKFLFSINSWWDTISYSKPQFRPIFYPLFPSIVSTPTLELAFIKIDKEGKKMTEKSTPKIDLLFWEQNAV